MVKKLSFWSKMVKKLSFLVKHGQKSDRVGLATAWIQLHGFDTIQLPKI